MIECLILGDSIAVGIGQMRPECVVQAKSGINSVQTTKNLDMLHWSLLNSLVTVLWILEPIH